MLTGDYRGKPYGPFTSLTRLQARPIEILMPLPLLSYDQLLTANFFDFRQIVLCKLPKYIWRDVIVSITKNIADPCYFWPRNFGSSLLYVVREMATRFGNNFNSALNQPAFFPILFEAPSVTPSNTRRMRSIASMISARRGATIRSVIKKSARRLLRSLS